jgi:hypothetical protein
MAVWSAFATEILDLIEHGSVMFPGIASNGVVNRYVELVLQKFFAQLHSSGLSASGSDAALLLLKMDVSNDVFSRMQLDAELLNRGGGGGYKRAAQDVPAQAGIGVDSTTASVAKKPRGTSVLFLIVLSGRVQAGHFVQVFPQEAHVGGREGRD